MKKIFIFLVLCLVMIVSFFGCTQGDRENDTVPGTTMTPTITQGQVPGGAQGNQGPGGLGAS